MLDIFNGVFVAVAGRNRLRHLTDRRELLFIAFAAGGIEEGCHVRGKG